MDVRVEAAPALAHAEAVEPVVTVSILAAPVVLVRLPLVVASTRIPSVGNSSLSAVPAPCTFEGGYLANAA